MTSRGRPKGPRIIVPCAADTKCCRAVNGEPALVEKRPSEYSAATTGRVFCDAACRNAVGGRLAHPRIATCQNPEHPLDKPREFTYDRRLHEGRKYCSWECYDMQRRAAVEVFACGWCGLPVEANIRLQRKYHTSEAPEPECGWPDGIRMTCWQLGQYKNILRPLRFVNGKPVRLWYDRRDPTNPVARPMVWDPTKGEEGDWEFEHRYLWQEAHGVHLTSDIHIHHDDLNKLNNDLGNLRNLTPSEHMALHNAQRIAAAEEAMRLRKLLEQHGINPDEG